MPNTCLMTLPFIRVFREFSVSSKMGIDKKAVYEQIYHQQKQQQNTQSIVFSFLTFWF